MARRTLSSRSIRTGGSSRTVADPVIAASTPPAAARAAVASRAPLTEIAEATTAERAALVGRYLAVPGRAGGTRVPATPEGRTSPTARVLRGRVHDATTGAPLGGLTVTAYVCVVSGDDDRRSRRETRVGEGRTGPGGGFGFTMQGAAGTRGDVALLGRVDDAHLELVVEDARGAELLRSDPLALDEADVELLVPLELATPTAGDWAELAERAEEARRVGVHEIAGDLTTGGGAVADWPAARRLGALAALERAFVDPDGVLGERADVPTFHEFHATTRGHDFLGALVEVAGDEPVEVASLEALGRATAFRTLREVDWPMDTIALRSAQVGQAMGAFAVQADITPTLTDKGDLSGALEAMPTGPKDSQLIAYRDYLRTIVTGGSRTEEFATRHEALETRFHQDFRVTDTSEQPVNEILIPILKAILTADTGAGYGFGLSNSAIPARDDKGAREYLDELIDLTDTNASMLSVRYRCDFTRPDGVTSSRVRENVRTLQAFLADGFQAPADPHDPIIPQALLGQAPFFLQEDEWRALRAPYHPENHIPLKRTFTSGIADDDREYATNKASNGNEWFLDLMEAEELLASGHRWVELGQYTKAREDYEACRKAAWLALQESVSSKAADNIGLKNYPLSYFITPAVESLHAMAADDPDGLQALVDKLAPPYKAPGDDPINPYDEWNPWLEQSMPRHVFSLLRLITIILPTSLGDVALAEGLHAEAIEHYERATGAMLGRGTMGTPPGWRRDHYDSESLASEQQLGGYGFWILYRDGRLPYTIDVSEKEESVYDPEQSVSWTLEAFSAYAPRIAHVVERRYLRLRLGKAMLDWADALYRTDEAASIRRARELYKAALFVHDKTPPGLKATWPKPKMRFELSKLEDAVTAMSQAMTMSATSGIDPAATSTGITTSGGRTLQAAAVRRALPVGDGIAGRAALARGASLSPGGGAAPVGDGGTTPMSLGGGGASSTSTSNGGAMKLAVSPAGLMQATVQVTAGLLQRVPGWTGFHLIGQNPALTSQIRRAHTGLLQIDAGLNVYGLTDDLVPSLRYEPLARAAGDFAASAKSTQQDLLVYMGNVENAIKEQIVTAHMLEKAMLQAQIAGEQIEIAKYVASLAGQQVAAVEKQIEEKRKQLEEEKEFWNQFTGFIGGMVTAITDLPDDLTGWAGGGAAGAVGLGSLTGGGGGGAAGGAAGGSAGSGAGAGAAAGAGLAAGGAMMAGYGILVYAGISSMVSMGEEINGLADEIEALEDVALPAAERQLEAKNREVKIAQLNQSVAMADAQLAKDLIDFARDRVLNVDFWAELATVMKRILRRYLALGARYAWMAERAAAYEQDRTLDLIRMDYVPAKLMGVTGADLLQADLAELEALYREGQRSAVPITHTVSLAFEFPIAFARLKTTGTCSFRTTDAGLRRAHPGTFAHRIRAVSVDLLDPHGVAPYRGVLRNEGVSTFLRRDGSRRTMLRPAEALPLSGFRLRPDMGVFGLPNETLLTFEGSGAETIWTLQLPPGGNPYGLDKLADVQIAFDLLADWSPALAISSQGVPPAPMSGVVFVSLGRADLGRLIGLRGATEPATVAFDLSSVPVPVDASANGGGAAARRITNLVVMVAGTDEVGGLDVTVAASDPGASATVTLDGGVALTNAGVLAAGEPALPLNALLGGAFAQTIEVTLDPGADGGGDDEEPGVLAGVKDVVIGVEWETM